MDFGCESTMTFDNEMSAEVSNVSDSKLFMNEFKARVVILIREEQLFKQVRIGLAFRGEMVFSRS